MENVKASLTDLIAEMKRLGVDSITVPPLGCGNVHLDSVEVRPRIAAAFAQVPDVRLLAPQGVRKPRTCGAHESLQA